MKKGFSTYWIDTFGCQMNVNDSERSAGLLRHAGLVPASSRNQSDLVLIHTCAVREKAEKKLFSLLGRLRLSKTNHPGMNIIVGGCVAQLHGRSLLDRAPQIDAVIGTHCIHRIPDVLKRLGGETGEKIVDVSRYDRDLFSMPPSLIAHTSTVRAYVTVMEGCSHVCSYCVVPRTRGPERCRPYNEIVAEVEQLIRRGFQEVMFLGQMVNAYRWGKKDLADLLDHVAAIPKLRRLRFTSNHPTHITTKLAEVMRDHANICPQIHLPVQSGSDRILKSMRRGYTSKDYIEKVALLRRIVPDIAVTSDIIVGYPGETEDDFSETMRLLNEVRFDGLFSFLYSSRPGTLAQTFNDDVPLTTKRRRLNELNGWQQACQRARHREFIGTQESVLVDQVNSKGQLCGRTKHLRIVHFHGTESFIGKTVSVEIVDAGANSLTGRWVEGVAPH
ncbi:MAG: tRNA (N6-isopentenyl adenosine(37)-C2)-methylthiotransferase MiaB [Vicinamibacteria bacterium]|nr:tRNA (N6-isopentenyl adenosine(37)-C2)-methylthiotransferase MiaB [Vicinamibacteria bacterium]